MIKCGLLDLKEKANALFNINNISHDLKVKLIYTSLAFEYPNISYSKVEDILNGKNNDAALLVNNQNNAFEYIVSLIKSGEELNENKLKDLHEILMKDILEVSGLYRNVDISIKGSNHTPPSHIKVYDRMNKYFDYLAQSPSDLLEYISFSHLQLAKVHPFLDGNGRCARLVLNYELMKNGFAPVYILPEERNEYYNTLEEFKVNKDSNPFKEFLLKIEARSLNL
ncbi:MAG: Fic family protein [Bacilli bacterium]|nr:Fic family protein [Bacilli bacterium]MBP5550443.1 Fic family protein [Bacilli bacterium]